MSFHWNLQNSMQSLRPWRLVYLLPWKLLECAAGRALENIARVTTEITKLCQRGACHRSAFSRSSWVRCHVTWWFAAAESISPDMTSSMETSTFTLLSSLSLFLRQLCIRRTVSPRLWNRWSLKMTYKMSCIGVLEITRKSQKNQSEKLTLLLGIP